MTLSDVATLANSRSTLSLCFLLSHTHSELIETIFSFQFPFPSQALPPPHAIIIRMTFDPRAVKRRESLVDFGT